MKNAYLVALFSALLFLTPVAAQNAPVEKGKNDSPRASLIAAARSYLGVPYLSGGTSREGMDCSGLVYRAGLDAFNATFARTASALSAQAETISDEAREPGDLLFFNTVGRLTHVGIYLGGGAFIHAASDGPKTGVIVSALSESYWKRTYDHAGRILAQESVHIPQSPETPASEANPFPFEGQIGFRLNATGGVLWDLTAGSPIRGGVANFELSWARGAAYPGLGAGIAWDDRTDSLSVPLTFSLASPNGLRVFLGTQLHLLAASGLNADPRFPGIFGVSWTSPPLHLAQQNLRFYQDLEYSWLDDETFYTGFRFTTGITLSFDI
jgi:probable lipoprotein NlpC